MVGTRKVLGAALGAAVLVGAGDASAATPKRVKLKAFASCASLVGYAERNVARFGGQVVLPAAQTIGAPGGAMEDGSGGPQPVTSQPAPAEKAADDFSTTNVQEAGVDEPDVVKSDGTRLLALANGVLHAVATRGEPRLLGSLKLSDSYGGEELLIRGERALVLGTRWDYPQPAGGDTPTAKPASVAAPYGGRSVAVLTEIDISDPAAMRVLRRQEVDGQYVAARLNGSIARVVIGSTPRAYAMAAERDELRGWMPRTTIVRRGRRTRRAMTSCTRVRRPASYSGAGMVSVLTIDLERGLPASDVDTIMSDSQTIYGSQSSLYIATQRTFEYRPDVEPPAMRTAIHRFSARAGDTEYRGSGEVRGYLLNQFSLSERNGFLRVASTEAPLWWGSEQQRQSESLVSTLNVDDGRLTPTASVGGLGKGERIYSVRFIDDVAYVVTFRQVDPLYTVDVGDPAAPKVLGELKVLGYSAYLHPAGKDLILGVGQDASPEGQTQGTQLQLFDVSDLTAPKLLHKRSIGQWSSSEVEYDHRAFLHWPATGLAVVPVSAYAGKEPFVGAIGFRVDATTGIDEVGRIQHPAGEYSDPIRRAAVVGDRLFTVSTTGVKASRLDSLADVSFVRFASGR